MARGGWDLKMINKLLPKGCGVILNANGKVRANLFNLDRVVEVERSVGILPGLNSFTRAITTDEKDPVSYMLYNIDRIEAEIISDLQGMNIPKTGTLEETYSKCLGKAKRYKAQRKHFHTSDIFEHAVIGGKNRSEFAYHVFEYIGKKRPDLAFEAGYYHAINRHPMRLNDVGVMVELS